MGWSPFRKTGLTYKDGRSFGGYTLITPIGGEATYLVDEFGQVVQQWHDPDFKPGYGYLLPGGNLLVRGQPAVGGQGVVDKFGTVKGKSDLLKEYSWEGEEVWSWENDFFHHDMCRMPNGNTLVIMWEPVPDDILPGVKGGASAERLEQIREDPHLLRFLLSGVGVGGRPSVNKMMVDAIWEIDQQGTAVHVWHAYDYLDPETDLICPMESPMEWTHANAIEYVDGNKILVSFRELSQVWLIDWPGGEVIWKLPKGIVSHQHSPTMTKDRTIMIFDNGTHHLIQGRTRVVEYDWKSNQLVWQYVPSPVFSLMSGHIGGSERLPNGNTLICEGESGRVFEVTPDGEFCWEWISPFIHDFKGVLNVQLFRAHRYAADSPELRGRVLNPNHWKDVNEKWGLIG